MATCAISAADLNVVPETIVPGRGRFFHLALPHRGEHRADAAAPAQGASYDFPG